MIGERRVMQKLEELGMTFRQHANAKRYRQAKICYEQARTVAVFMELSEENKSRLFGERGDSGEILKEGIFREEVVVKVLYEVDVRGTTT